MGNDTVVNYRRWERVECLLNLLRLSVRDRREVQYIFHDIQLEDSR